MMAAPSWAIPVKEKKTPSWAVPIDDAPETSLTEALLPRTVKGGSVVAGPALDVLSLPGRALASGPGRLITGEIEPQEFLQNMAETQGNGIAQKIARDPMMATAPLGGPLVSGMKGLGVISSQAATKGLPYSLRTLGAAGAAEGGLGASIHQSDRALAGEEVSPLGAAFETGLGAVLPVAPSIANKALGRLAEGLSGVSEEALRMYGTGFGQGAKSLKSAAGKQNEIGLKLATAIDNAYDYMPEKGIVDEALKKMPDVNVSKTLAILDEKARLLEKPAIGKPLEAEAKAAKEIRKAINSIRGSTSPQFQKVIHPAADVRDLRKRLDLQLDDAMGADVKDAVDKALIAARSQLKNDLIDAAKASGNPQYVDAMETWSNKLQKVDEIKDILGGNRVTRKQRAESFTANLFGKNKTERQKLVADLGKIFGEDFLEQSKLARLASELGPEGVPGFLPMQGTGRSGLGFSIGGSALSSGGTASLLTGNPAYLAAAAPAVAIGTLASPQVASKTLGAADVTGRYVKPVAPAIRAGLRSLGQRNY